MVEHERWLLWGRKRRIFRWWVVWWKRMFGEEKAKVGESLEGNLEAEAPLAMEIKYGGIGEDIAEHGDVY